MDLLIEAALRATVIACVVGLALRAGRITTPRLVHAAWVGVVVAMLLLPALVMWAPRAAIPLPAAPAVSFSPTGAQAEPNPLPALVPMPLADSGATSTAAPPRAIDWWWLATAVYICGVIVLLARVALGAWYARRLLAGAVTVGSHWVHPRCTVPLTFGLFVPRVILPPDWKSWDARELAAVLTHEREHARRRDPLIGLLTLINRAVFWFHPLAWWLHRRVSALAEQACDAVVLAQGHDASAYSESLLRFARRTVTSRGRVQPLTMAIPGSGLAARLERIADGTSAIPASPVRRLLTGGVCLIAILTG